MTHAPSFELKTCVENIDFWASTELGPGCDRAQILAVFHEMARRAHDMAAPGDLEWLEGRLAITRYKIDRRITPRPLDASTVAASVKARAMMRRSSDRLHSPGPGAGP